jgi:NosR/NirI family nitrous oxide reductase transcriptional regulator
MVQTLKRAIRGVLDSPNMASRRPVVDGNFQSNIPGLYIIGDLAGAPVVKLAMEQGFTVAEHIAAKPDARTSEPDCVDVIVAGAGAAGLNAALVLQEKGLRVVVLEKNRIANTIEDFPEGKWVYAEPDARLPKGKLWLDGARKEDLLARWHGIIRDNRLDVRTEEGVTAIVRRRDRTFEVRTEKAVYRARRVILATGQRGNPRKLGVPGEDREEVYHRLYSPKHYRDEDILVVGGGNSAVEAALTLAEQNRVTLCYRGASFTRVFRDNERKLAQAVEAGRIRVLFGSNVQRFGDGTCTLEVRENGSARAVEVPYRHAFVLIGAELPAGFLRSLGIRLENEWTPGRFAWLAVAFAIAYTIYGAKQAPGHEFWPYTGWGFAALSFFERPWSFWYTVLYTVVMTVFGIQAMKRWGLDRKDKFQIWRYVSLLSFQWIFFFLAPEFLFRWAVEYQWVGERLASDPAFAEQAWRSYGIVYAWPLFFYTFFGSPHQVWVVWGVLLSFVILPVLVLFHGKRYCSWVCGCGGLAETLGDRWRHLAPKGKASLRWERMNLAVLAAAVAITVMMVTRDAIAVFRAPAQAGLDWYHLIADVWLVGILPVTLYPFFGGKIWCRYWCPLAKMMELFSSLYARLRVSRFAIHANDKCIACGECSRYCQVGIDVMNFALKQEVLNNANGSCIGCGICVTVCPMDTLSFSAGGDKGGGLVRISSN